jgi:hypothetical protein
LTPPLQRLFQHEIESLELGQRVARDVAFDETAELVAHGLRGDLPFESA